MKGLRQSACDGTGEFSEPVAAGFVLSHVQWQGLDFAGANYGFEHGPDCMPVVLLRRTDGVHGCLIFWFKS